MEGRKVTISDPITILSKQAKPYLCLSNADTQEQLGLNEKVRSIIIAISNQMAARMHPRLPLFTLIYQLCEPVSFDMGYSIVSRLNFCEPLPL